MKKKTLALFIVGGALSALFVALTALLKTVDVAAIGPEGSEVGFSAFNKACSVPMNDTWYKITEYLGYCAIGIALGFALLAVIQAVKRKSVIKVDRDLLLLVGFECVLVACYIAFDLVKINYRPVIVEGELEPSFPSTHTLIAVFVLFVSLEQAFLRMKKPAVKWTFCAIVTALCALIVVGRIVSGVHWITDIIGGAILAAALGVLYYACCSLVKDKTAR